MSRLHIILQNRKCQFHFYVNNLGGGEISSVLTFSSCQIWKVWFRIIIRDIQVFKYLHCLLLFSFFLFYSTVCANVWLCMHANACLWMATRESCLSEVILLSSFSAISKLSWKEEFKEVKQAAAIIIYSNCRCMCIVLQHQFICSRFRQISFHCTYQSASWRQENCYGFCYDFSDKNRI